MYKKKDIKENLLVCDLDGTLIKEDLEKCFMIFLLQKKKVKLVALALAVLLTPINLLCHWLERGSIWKVWVIGMSNAELESFMEEFFLEWNYTVCDSVKSHIVEFEGKKMLLTGSFEKLALRWLQYADLLSLFDEVIGCRVYDQSCQIDVHPYGKTKLDLLEGKVPNIALANEYADRHLLEVSKKAICVGGDPRLLAVMQNHSNLKVI